MLSPGLFFGICVLTFRPRVLSRLLLVRTLLVSCQQLPLPLQTIPLALVLAGFLAARAVTGVHLWLVAALHVLLRVVWFRHLVIWRKMIIINLRL